MGDSSNVSDYLSSINDPTTSEIEDVGEKVKTAAYNARVREIQAYYRHAMDDAKADGIWETDDHAAMNQAKADRDEALEAAETEFDYIPELFTAFTTPSPSYTSAILIHLSDVRATLTGAATEKVDSVEALISDWTGDAAMQFAQGFLNPFPKSVDNQVEVVDEMRRGVGAFEAILRHSRKDVKDIGDKTAQVLDSLDDWSSDDLKPVLGVVGAVVGLLGALPSGGASLGLALLSFSISVTSTALATEINGNTVDDIIQQMNDNLEAVRTGMRDNENGLSDALDASYETMSGIVTSSSNQEQRDLVPNRPNIADGGANHNNFEVPPEVQ